MVLSVGLFLIPGGASFILLGLRAGLQVANAAVMECDTTKINLDFSSYILSKKNVA